MVFQFNFRTQRTLIQKRINTWVGTGAENTQVKVVLGYGKGVLGYGSMNIDKTARQDEETQQAIRIQNLCLEYELCCECHRITCKIPNMPGILWLNF